MNPGESPTTKPKVDIHEENCVSDEMAEVLRQKTSTERLQIGFEMWRSARRMTRAAVKHQHPDWTDEMVDREVASRMSHGLV